MLTALVLAVLVQAAPVQDTAARGTIHGHVQSEPTGLPVPLAVVEADDGRHNVLTMADSTGAYRLRVGAGRQTLRVHHLDHAPTQMEVLVPAGGELDLDVMLRHRPITLAPVNVRPSIDPGADSVAVSRSEFNLTIVRRATEDAGLAQTLNGGFGSLPDGSGGGGEALYVRGSAANLQLVLLDGAPVYAPFHMGGLIESFEPEVVGEAALYLGGAPARYDGGLSYVMDLETRSGNGARHSAGGTVDMVSVTGRAEGPVAGGVRYLASGRTVHGASIAQLESEPFPYAFRDGLLRLDLPLRDGGVSLTAFANHEGVRVDTLGGDGLATWGNQAGSLRYGGRFEGADVEMTVAAGRFDAFIPLRDAGRLFLLSSRSDRVRSSLDFTRQQGPVSVRYGGSFERTWLTHDANQSQNGQVLVHTEAAGSAVGAYVDTKWQPDDRVVLRGGVRADAFSVGGAAVFAPRASATWLLTDNAALTLAAGRYHQYIRVPRPLYSSTLRNFADSMRIATHLAVGGATHLSLSLDQQLAPDVRLGLEGFYKRFDGLPDPRPRSDSSYTAHNSGVDVWVRRTGGRVTGWLGYSLGWAWSSSLLQDTVQFLGRQTLTAGVRGTVWRRTVLSARFAYGAGLPSTRLAQPSDPINDGGSIPSLENSSGGVDLDTDAPLTGINPFLRLDAEVSRTWSPRVGGRRTQVTPYLRLINALENRDGLFYRYLEDTPASGTGNNSAPSPMPDGATEAARVVRNVTTLPLVPVAGITWKF
ncbi:TonB-dependent receptor [Longimicrobium sp.]|uniref:TonB-dependent receptor n=1 Tax=Longimicrobium sp. TaxID=2029185 RepID=UPI002E328650|nr:TonB-dependent receptor [Longimicrobium sp.]HEX6037367.1 TonB-dependent receptor [Longimicrobium sp.]